MLGLRHGGKGGDGGRHGRAVLELMGLEERRSATLRTKASGINELHAITAILVDYFRVEKTTLTLIAGSSGKIGRKPDPVSVVIVAAIILGSHA